MLLINTLICSSIILLLRTKKGNYVAYYVKIFKYQKWYLWKKHNIVLFVEKHKSYPPEIKPVIHLNYTHSHENYSIYSFKSIKLMCPIKVYQPHSNEVVFPLKSLSAPEKNN